MVMVSGEIMRVLRFDKKKHPTNKDQNYMIFMTFPDEMESSPCLMTRILGIKFFLV